MQMRLLTARVGPRIDQQRGEIIDVPEAEGHRMVAKGLAVEQTTGRKQVEAAVDRRRQKVRPS